MVENHRDTTSGRYIQNISLFIGNRSLNFQAKYSEMVDWAVCREGKQSRCTCSRLLQVSFVVS